MTRPVLGVELSANTSCIVSSPCDESCSDSVLSAVQIPACRRSLLPESNVQVHGLIHSKSASRSSSFSLAFVASSALSRRGSSNSPVFVTVDVLSRVLILSSRYRDSCHRHTSNVHLRAFASLTLCLWRHVQCRGFSCSRGRCSRPELSIRSHRRQHSLRRHNKNIRPCWCLLLTSGIGLSLSSNIRVLRNSTQSLW